MPFKSLKKRLDVIKKDMKTAHALAMKQLAQEKKKKKMSVLETIKRKKEILEELLKEAGRR